MKVRKHTSRIKWSEKTYSASVYLQCFGIGVSFQHRPTGHSKNAPTSLFKHRLFTRTACQIAKPAPGGDEKAGGVRERREEVHLPRLGLALEDQRPPLPEGQSNTWARVGVTDGTRIRWHGPARPIGRCWEKSDFRSSWGGAMWCPDGAPMATL